MSHLVRRCKPLLIAVYDEQTIALSKPHFKDVETLKLNDNDLGSEVNRAVRAKYRPALIVLSGERVGVRVSVQGNIIIGRDADAGLSLPDPGVSWHHAMLQDRGGTWTLVDLGSTNGIAVNGEKVA